MTWYKLSQSDVTRAQDSFWDDFFGNTATTPEKQQVRVDPAVEKPVTLTLYRGMDVDPSKLDRGRGGGYILSPAKCEQGVMWFTHNLINGYNPIQYVTGRGSHLLTYPLNVIKHEETVHYSDGSTHTRIPQGIQNQQEPTENCRFYMGYELPSGWFFSYKTEKFIICTRPIVIQESMLRPQQPVDE